jgi:8-amino-7-oxononanoate synthase
MQNDSFLLEKLEVREQDLALRSLKKQNDRIDFCSNDYLGLARNKAFQKEINQEVTRNLYPHGSTGSRLISGNHPLFEKTEIKIARFHHAEEALIFNSGYDANVGLISAIAGRGDAIVYDSLIHASLRDGIRLSLATAYSFLHNDMRNLEEKLKRLKRRSFVVVESVYSMDGDQAPLEELIYLCNRYEASLIVDEAHATGVIGEKGEGLVQHLGIERECFARVHTFGKALGVHGAVVLGSKTLKQYLINYARTLIYTTALPPSDVAAISVAYDYFPKMKEERKHLQQLISHFQRINLPFGKLPSNTPIQILIVPDNEEVLALANTLQRKGLDIKAILSPTVPKGKERLRITLHSFNTFEDIQRLIVCLQNY